MERNNETVRKTFVQTLRTDICPGLKGHNFRDFILKVPKGRHDFIDLSRSGGIFELKGYHVTQSAASILSRSGKESQTE